MASQLVTQHITDGVGVLSFNRPAKHNALSDELLGEWRVALGELFADTEVRCVLLRGEGESFSSGRDTTQLGRRATGESDFAFILREQREALRLRRAGKPIVAALKGWVLGGAFELALHADLRVASTDARLGLPEVGYGIVPDVGGIAILHALAGPERTKRLVMTGTPIDAETALAWGIVGEIVPSDHLDEAAIALARALAAGSTEAVRRSKELVDALTDAAVDEEIARELRAQVELFGLRPRRE